MHLNVFKDVNHIISSFALWIAFTYIGTGHGAICYESYESNMLWKLNLTMCVILPDGIEWISESTVYPIHMCECKGKGLLWSVMLLVTPKRYAYI